MKEVIHQAVHGYAGGHVPLASSLPLGQNESDLLTRLSDLSGGLLGDDDFAPYLTLYPLPGDRFYAVARTWSDRAAPRAGCVLTHTLLVPMDMWRGLARPERLITALRKPVAEDFSAFRQPISVPNGEDCYPSVSGQGTYEFLMRYFVEGLRPIAWFGASDVEAIAWKVIGALWPLLRGKFSLCTFALKPRTLTDRPFDVLFAPDGAFARFAEYPREHVIQASHDAFPNDSEPWLSRWNDHVFGSVSHQDRLRDLTSRLEPFPTAVRRVCVFLDLCARVREVPIACLGALDILATLGFEQSRQTSEAAPLIEASIEGATELPPDQMSELLYLLAERIERSYPAMRKTLAPRIVNLVAEKGSSLWESVDNLLQVRALDLPSALMDGIVQGILRLNRLNEVRPIFLTRTLGRLTFAASPDGALKILLAARDFLGADEIETIERWCLAIPEASLAKFRRVFLPVLKDREAKIASALTASIAIEEVPSLCRAILEGPAAGERRLAPMYVGALFQQQKVSSLGGEWTEIAPNSFFAARLLATSLPQTNQSLDLLLSNIDRASKSPLAVGLFVALGLSRLPCAWLISRLANDRVLWDILLRLLADESDHELLASICETSPRSAISRVDDAALRLGSAPIGVQRHALLQLVKDWIDGLIDQQRLQSFFEQRWLQDVIENNQRMIVSNVSSISSTDQWLRAWLLISALPVSISNGAVVGDAISLLLLHPWARWTRQVIEAWRTILLSYVSHQPQHLDLCRSGLQFCLNMPQLSVAGVVELAFYPVHDAALRERDGNWGVFSFLQWDRGLELRRRLIDAFCRGHWEPECFVLAAKEPWLLRKLCHRMLRQWRGDQFLQRAYSAVHARRDVAAENPLLVTLKDILLNPRYSEDWD